MKLAQVTFALVLASILTASLPAKAQVAIASNAEVIGVWNLDGSAKNLTEEKRPGQQTWEFKPDGTLASAGYDRRLPGGNFSVSSSYEVKDGKIVADVVGRPGKKTTYTVIEKSPTSMTLKEGLGEYLFFSKK